MRFKEEGKLWLRWSGLVVLNIAGLLVGVEAGVEPFLALVVCSLAGFVFLWLNHGIPANPPADIKVDADDIDGRLHIVNEGFGSARIDKITEGNSIVPQSGTSFRGPRPSFKLEPEQRATYRLVESPPIATTIRISWTNERGEEREESYPVRFY